MGIDEVIQKLKETDLSKYPYDEIRELFNQVGPKADIVVHLRQDYSIFRGRANTVGEVFDKDSDYSYKPQRFNTTYQRASTPNNTAFYGVIFDNKIKGESEKARATAFGEIFHSGIDIEKTPKISYGRWEVKRREQLNLVAIIQEDLYKDKNNLIGELRSSYENFLENCKDEVLRNKTMKFNTFLANEFSKRDIKEDYDYMISAIYSELIFNHILDFDGIIYPSVRAGGLCFNIAIKPESVDTKMELKVKGECNIKKIEEGYLVE